MGTARPRAQRTAVPPVEETLPAVRKPTKRAPRPRKAAPVAETPVDPATTISVDALDDLVERRVQQRMQQLMEAAPQAEEQPDETPVDASGIRHAFPLFEVRDAKGVVVFSKVIEVTAPNIEQVMVMRRLQGVFSEAAKVETMSLEEAERLTRRAVLAATSIMVHPEDADLVEDLILDTRVRLTLTSLMPLISASMTALQAANADQQAGKKSKAVSAGGTGRASLATSE